jgi:3-methylcrotonyl-CoA carboxylase alpha subunit
LALIYKFEFLDGVQQHFYIAEDVQDVNEKSIFVHDFVRGYQVELVKVDRLKSKAASLEDDRGNKRNHILQ